VDRRGWLSDREFAETLALCQSLPGPNIVNLSVVVGARFGGARGAFACVTGLVLAPVAMILVIATLWGRYGEFGRLPAVVRAMAAVAAGLTGATALKLGRPVLARDPAWRGALIAAAFVGVGVLRLPLPWVFLALASIAILIAWRRTA
jgi:chromate transporter